MSIASSLGGYSCQSCHQSLTAGAKFCSKCGAKQGPTCPACFQPVKATSKFCPHCGKPLAVVAAPVVAVAAPTQQAPVVAPVQPAPEMMRDPVERIIAPEDGKHDVPVMTPAPAPAPTPVPIAPILYPDFLPPPTASSQLPEPVFTNAPPINGQQYPILPTPTVAVPATMPNPMNNETPAPPLPPPSSPWSFQPKITSFLPQALSFLTSTGIPADSVFGKILNRMLRACLLDATVFREVAEEDSQQKDAFFALGIILLLPAITALFLSFRLFSSNGISSTLATVVVQALGWFAGAWVAQQMANRWLKLPTTYLQILRPLIYALSPAVFGIIPALGQLLSLWAIVTSVFALREVCGCTNAQAGALLLAAGIASVVATMLTAPLLVSLALF